jgi:hypothetical protein
MKVYIKQHYLVWMIQHSKVSDEVALFNVNSHMMAVVMIQNSKVSDEVGGAV